MTIKQGDIVLRRLEHDYDELSVERYRVEDVSGTEADIRDLTTYMVDVEDVSSLVRVYSTEFFEKGDIVRVRGEYQDHYSEADGYNDLTVIVGGGSGKAPTTQVENINGDQFSILNERLHLVRPAVGYKAGDRVVIDPERVKKFPNDVLEEYWKDAGVLVLTEDSGSRMVQQTSHVRYENDTNKDTNNVPTRWLKLYEEPAKRVVGESVKFEDIKVGDKIKAVHTSGGLLREYTGVVLETYNHYGTFIVRAQGGAVFPYESGVVFTLLEEAPEPVDENLQRLLDAEIGDIALGTYADEYWAKIEDDEWELIGHGMVKSTERVFDSIYKLKYGTLEIYKKAKDAN